MERFPIPEASPPRQRIDPQAAAHVALLMSPQHPRLDSVHALIAAMAAPDQTVDVHDAFRAFTWKKAGARNKWVQASARQTPTGFELVALVGNPKGRFDVTYWRTEREDPLTLSIVLSDEPHPTGPFSGEQVELSLEKLMHAPAGNLAKARAVGAWFAIEQAGRRKEPCGALLDEWRHAAALVRRDQEIDAVGRRVTGVCSDT